MAHKFVKSAHQKDMINVDIDGVGTKWLFCDKAVKTFAKMNFKEGDEIEFDYEEKDGKFTVNGYVKKAGSEASSEGYTPPPEAKSSYSGGSGYKSQEVQESIKRQAIGHMVSRSLIALQGHVDLSNIEKTATSLYKTYQTLVG